MSYTLVETSSFSGSIAVPAVGDGITATSVRTGFQALANRTLFLSSSLVPVTQPRSSIVATYPLATRSITRTQDGMCLIGSDGAFPGNPGWFSDSDGVLKSQVSTPVVHIVQRLDLPTGSLLTSVTAHLKGKSGHGALPGTMPTLTLNKRNKDTGVTTNLTVATADGSGTTVGYETLHPLSLNALTESIHSSQYAYNVVLRSEAGSDATDTLECHGFDATFTVTFEDPGAS